MKYRIKKKKTIDDDLYDMECYVVQVHRRSQTLNSTFNINFRFYKILLFIGRVFMLNTKYSLASYYIYSKKL